MQALQFEIGEVAVDSGSDIVRCSHFDSEGMFIGFMNWPLIQAISRIPSPIFLNFFLHSFLLFCTIL